MKKKILYFIIMSGMLIPVHMYTNEIEQKTCDNSIQLPGSDSVLAYGISHEFIPEINLNETGNPFIRHMYTADPSAHVFNNRVYVYTSHDQNNADGFNMRDYHVFSSADLNTWEDHGVILDVDSVPWAKEYMWAPDCSYRNGTYYFYFPAKDFDGKFRIGVATSASPVGPFIPESEPIKGSFSVDPAVFIDDDGQAYMYFGGAGDGGQTTPWVAKMSEDMKEFSEKPIALTGIDYWFEACWMNKFNDTYYLSYSTGEFHSDYPDRSILAYATSDNPFGPFTYQGVINGYVSGWTNHHSVVNYLGQSYLFYHNSELSGGNTVKRSICADYIHFANGKLGEVIQTEQGVGWHNGSNRIETENYFEVFGAKKQECSEGGYQVSFSSEDSLIFKNITFEEKTMNSIQFRVKSPNKDGYLEILADSNGTLGKIQLSNLNEVHKWQTLNCPVRAISGKRQITVKFKSESSNTVGVNWFEFIDSTAVAN